MRKVLIPLLVCLFGSATVLLAQVPRTVKTTAPLNSKDYITPEKACDNFAGTFQLGKFVGQSNDITLDTIYLCAKDSIFINHDGNARFPGDPVTTTAPGVVWGFYTCEPTVSGPELRDLVQSGFKAYDTCLVSAPDLTNPGSLLPQVALGTPDGDIWFDNDGTTLQTRFNNGEPVLLWFAPMTIDDFGKRTYESNSPSIAPGSCVNVNVASAFAVYYLKAIRHTNLVTPYDNNDCIGSFNIEGGYPETDQSKTYKIDIFLESDPTVKGIIRLPSAQIKDRANVVFSVPKAGVYVIRVEDGKSCDYQFKANMGACTPADNVKFIFPEVTVPPGKPVCVPVTTENFLNLVGTSFSIGWDPTVLTFTSIQNPHPSITGIFNPSSNINAAQVPNGFLGVAFQIANATDVINVPNGQKLFDICFDAIGQLDDCSGLTITNRPSQVDASNATGSLAISVDTGSVCLKIQPLVVEFKQDTFCNGSASISVAPKGGIIPYEVTIQQIQPSGATTSSTIDTSGGVFIDTVFTSGRYKVCLIDNAGFGVPVCDTLNVDVSILGAQLDLTALPKCFGDSNGSVTARVIFGSTQVANPGPNFSFAWPSPLPQNVATQTNIPSGNYTVTITDKNTGCTASAGGTLPNPPRLDNGAVTITPATCTGLDDGSISYAGEGGTPFGANQYSFTWAKAPTPTDPKGSPSIPMQTNPLILNNQGVGFYWLTITDRNNCIYRDSFDLDALRELSLDINVTAATCSYTADGAIVVDVTATPAFTSANYTFTWSPTGNGTATSTPTQASLRGARPAKFAFTAIEASGCKITDSIEVTGPPPLVLDTVELKNPTCLSPNNGSIQVFARGGTGGPNYSYRWLNNPSLNAPQQTGLDSGFYRVTVIDRNGCRDSLSFNLQLPAPPTITGITVQQPRCGDDGCLKVNAPTGKTYEWFLLGGGLVGTTAEVCSLPGDTFFVVVRDSLSCVSRDTADMTPVTPMTIFETTMSDPTCPGSKNGGIRVAVQGGTPNPSYIYNWSSTPPQTQDSLSGVGAGTYIVSVRDSKDCLLTDTFELKDPPGVNVQYTGLTPATCSDSCNAKATIQVQYATTPPTPGSFRFKWADDGIDSVRTNLCAGIQAVTITDSKGCVYQDSVSINSPTPVDTATLDSTPVSCFGGNDGTATAVGTGSNGAPFTYEWSNANATGVATSLVPGTYTVTIKDRLGCAGVFQVDVAQPDSITVSQNLAATKPISCFGLKDGALGVLVSGGNVGTLTYNWLAGGTTPSGTKATQDMLGAGSYDVVVTDVKGCTGVLRNLTLNDPPAVQGRYDTIAPIRCNGEETLLSIESISGGSGGPYRFSVDNGVPLEANATISVGGGDHTVTYFDNRGCSFSETLNIPEPPAVTVQFNPDEVEVELGDEYQLVPILNIVPAKFNWTPIETLKFKGDTLNDVVYTFKSQVYKLTVFDANGCSGTGEIVVNIDANRNIYVPNAFIPGNDEGTNDYFNVSIGKGVEKINYFRVYDRWGTLLYNQDEFVPDPDYQPSTGWDGRYNGQYVQPGVYIYILEAQFLDGRVLLYRGDVTVIR